jgi:hypothetical protein
MAKKQTLTVTTDAGTFTRTTARTYSHIVVVANERHEALEARRVSNNAHIRRALKQYLEIVRTGINPEDRTEWSRGNTAKRIADGSYANWISELQQKLAESTPITADVATDLSVLGWCGRLDLAVKLAAGEEGRRYRDVRIYALDGTRVQ